MSGTQTLRNDGPVEILLVEDNPDDAELTVRGLRQIANRIVWVKDGAEALDFLFARGQYAERNAHDKPRLVLLDLKLPKVDGLEVLRQIKDDPRLNAMPVVALTSSTEERDIVDTYAHGLNSYITKPVAFPEFQRAIEDLGMYWLLLNRIPETGPGVR